MADTLRVALAILAVWRLTHLVTREDGPWDVVRRVRQSQMAGRMLSCFYCLSVWVALPFAWFVRGSTIERLVAWWAISGAAILLERVTAEPLDIHIEDEHRGMLRSDDRSPEHQSG